MARQPRDPRVRLDRPGQRPLLQGHLRRGGQAPADPAAAAISPPPEPLEPVTPQPAAEGAERKKDAVRGKATRSPAKVATRRHLEGAEQGPM